MDAGEELLNETPTAEGLLGKFNCGIRWTVGIAGGLLTVYVTTALFGFVRSSSQYYAAFTFGVMFISGVVAIRNEINRKFPSIGHRIDPVRLAAAFIGTALATLGALYIHVNASQLETSAPFFDDFDMAVGLSFTVGVLILTWLHWGWVLAFLVSGSIGYFFFGHLVPIPLLTHPYYDSKFVMNYIGLGSTQGFFWFAQTAVDDIYYLILYASILFGIGMLGAILEFGKSMGNRFAGGAAAPAVIGSAIISMVMGTAVSNVMLAGRFTIPMMKKHGYSPAMAGAIEATASTSGQIMPPVLGLAAFMIASFLSMTYADVIKAAVIPGVLYMTGVAICVSIYAKRNKLAKLSETVDRDLILRTMPAFLISFATVCWLLVGYYSASLAGFCGCVVALVLSAFQGKHRPNGKRLMLALEEGMEMLAILSLLLIAIGPLGQAFLTTGLSGRLGIWMVSVLPDNTLLLLLCAAALAIILGMGLPTPVAYLVVALSLVPFLQQLGVKPFIAHYFVFYFAVYSALSPPIAVAALAAAKLSKASFSETCKDSMKIAATTFIVPIAFVYRPELLQFPNVGLNASLAIIDVLLVQWVSSVALYGYFKRDLTTTERWLFVLATLIGYWAMLLEAVYSTFVMVGVVAMLMLCIRMQESVSPSATSDR